MEIVNFHCDRVLFNVYVIVVSLVNPEKEGQADNGSQGADGYPESKKQNVCAEWCHILCFLVIQ